MTNETTNENYGSLTPLYKNAQSDAERWFWKELYRTSETPEAQIVHKCFSKWMPKKKRKLLNTYIRYGKEREAKVIALLSKSGYPTDLPLERIVYDVMQMEPYVIFYRRHILDELAEFESIEVWVEKTKQYISERPPSEEIKRCWEKLCPCC